MAKKKTRSKRKILYSSNRQTGSSSKLHDERKKAMPSGKRRSDGGRIYYEYRKNRTDKPNSMTGFFNNDYANLDQLKKAYYKLAKKYHPDSGGTEKDFQEMTAEYEELVNNFIRDKKFTNKEAKEEINIDEKYLDVIRTVMKIPNIEVEIIGTWIWLGGFTFPVRQELKQLGFNYAGQKKMWYINTTGTKTKRGKELPIEKIRAMYKSRKLKRDDENKFLSGIGINVDTKIKREFKNKMAALIRAMKKRK